MRGILIDVNLWGLMERLRAALESEKWVEFWTFLAVPLLSFEDVGLPVTARDNVVWQKCQESQWVLITGNRNSRGADSLQETIRRGNTADVLPVITVGDLDLVMESAEYVERATEKLLEYLLGIENLRGTGRLFVP
jgi:hypothetical protein